MSTKPIAPFKPIDFDLTRRNVKEFTADRNVPTPVFPSDDPSNRAGEGTPPASAQPVRSTVHPDRSPRRKFTVELPEYVITAIHDRALNQSPRSTTSYVIMAALAASGITIAAADLVPDGRRRTTQMTG